MLYPIGRLGRLGTLMSLKSLKSLMTLIIPRATCCPRRWTLDIRHLFPASGFCGGIFVPKEGASPQLTPRGQKAKLARDFCAKRRSEPAAYPKHTKSKIEEEFQGLRRRRLRSLLIVNEEAAFKRNEEITFYFAFLARILFSSAMVTLLLETLTKGVTASTTFAS